MSSLWALCGLSCGHLNASVGACRKLGLQLASLVCFLRDGQGQPLIKLGTKQAYSHGCAHQCCEQQRTINCPVVECVDGGAGRLLENVRTYRKMLSKCLCSIEAERESQPALHVLSGPTTV